MKIVLKSICALCAFALFAVIYYGVKNVAHKKCVRQALEMQCEKIQGAPKVVSVDIPKWDMLDSHCKYSCGAVLQMGDKGIPVSFTAQKVSGLGVLTGDVLNDDWEPNMGFWGWIGDDYHIRDITAKESK